MAWFGETGRREGGRAQVSGRAPADVLTVTHTDRDREKTTQMGEPPHKLARVRYSIVDELQLGHVEFGLDWTSIIVATIVTLRTMHTVTLAW